MFSRLTCFFPRFLTRRSLVSVSYTESEVPEARFSYDISPMAVTVSRTSRKSWYDFLTNLFAIVGGTFTTLGLIDGILYKAFKSKKL